MCMGQNYQDGYYAKLCHNMEGGLQGRQEPGLVAKTMDCYAEGQTLVLSTYLTFRENYVQHIFGFDLDVLTIGEF